MQKNISADHGPSAKKVVWTSFLVDVSDVALNLVVAVLSGSIVIFSQVLQGMADLMSSGLLLIGIKRASRRASREHQFGYGREVFFWTLISAVFMLFITGGLTFYLGLQRFLNPEPIQNLPLALGVLTLGLATNAYALSLSWRRITSGGRRLWTRLLHGGMAETKATLVLDLMGTLSSIFGLIALTYLLVFKDFRLDGLGAMIIGVVTAILAIFIIRDASDLLMGRAATPETEDEIRKAALLVKGVREVLDLRTMYIGSPHILVNIEVYLEPDLHTQEIEVIIDAIKNQIQGAVPSVQHIQVELETPEKEPTK